MVGRVVYGGGLEFSRARLMLRLFVDLATISQKGLTVNISLVNVFVCGMMGRCVPIQIPLVAGVDRMLPKNLKI